MIAPLLHVAGPLGVVIALAEFAVGLGAVLGLWARLAAVGGMALSLLLFLTVSYHSSPYYTGSDIVFVFAWTPLVISGMSGVLSLDGALSNLARRRVGIEPDIDIALPFSTVRVLCGFYENGCQARGGEPCVPRYCPVLDTSRAVHKRRPGELDRREFSLKGAWTVAIASAGLLGAALAAGLGRALARSGSPPVVSGNASPTTLGGVGRAPAGNPTTTTGVGAPTTHPPGTRIGPASAVPVAGATPFRDPVSGDPSLVIQPSAGRFLAFDAVCPHAGCIVQYERSGTFVCPCHGSEFNGSTGAVEAGPAPTGLTRLPVRKGSDGYLYVDGPA